MGIGGGFIISPLLMGIGYRTKEAAATTVNIVTFSSFSEFFGHMTHMVISPGLLIVAVVAEIVASLTGFSFMANRAKPTWARWLYGFLLLAVECKRLCSIVFLEAVDSDEGRRDGR